MLAPSSEHGLSMARPVQRISASLCYGKELGVAYFMGEAGEKRVLIMSCEIRFPRPFWLMAEKLSRPRLNPTLVIFDPIWTQLLINTEVVSCAINSQLHATYSTH